MTVYALYMEAFDALFGQKTANDSRRRVPAFHLSASVERAGTKKEIDAEAERMFDAIDTELSKVLVSNTTDPGAIAHIVQKAGKELYSLLSGRFTEENLQAVIEVFTSESEARVDEVGGMSDEALLAYGQQWIDIVTEAVFLNEKTNGVSTEGRREVIAEALEDLFSDASARAHGQDEHAPANDA